MVIEFPGIFFLGCLHYDLYLNSNLRSVNKVERQIGKTLRYFRLSNLAFFYYSFPHFRRIYCKKYLNLKKEYLLDY